MAKVPNGIDDRNTAENFNRLSRAHERYRQTTDGRATAYSEREPEFTFAKKAYSRHLSVLIVMTFACTVHVSAAVLAIGQRFH